MQAQVQQQVKCTPVGQSAAGLLLPEQDSAAGLSRSLMLE